MKTNYFKMALSSIALICIMMVAFVSCKSDGAKETMENVEEAAANVADETKEAVNSAAKEVKSMNREEDNTSRMVYNVTQVDSPPLFNKSCQEAKNPKSCSEDKLLDFIKKNAKFPKRANYDAKSLEQVIVVIEEDGSISSTKYIASEDEDKCEGCQQAAADVVGMMDNWVPAMKNGSPVAVQMTIPIRFGK